MYLFHLLLDNRVEYQYSIESILHTCWSDCHLLITSWRVILQCIFGVLRLLGHPAWWILCVPTGNLFSEKYSKLKHTSQIMKKEKQLTRHFSLVCPWILAVLHLQRRPSQQTIILLTESHIDIHCLHTCTIFLLYIR